MIFTFSGGYPSAFDIYEKINTTLQHNRSEAFKQLRETDLLTRNFVQLNAYFSDPEVRYFKQASVYPLEQFMSQVGGTMNLWIGITFVTIIEIVDLLLRIFSRWSKSHDSRTLNDVEKGSHTYDAKNDMSLSPAKGGSLSMSRYPNNNTPPGTTPANATPLQSNHGTTQLNHKKPERSDKQMRRHKHTLGATPYSEVNNGTTKQPQSEEHRKTNDIRNTISNPILHQKRSHDNRVLDNEKQKQHYQPRNKSPRKKTTVVQNGQIDRGGIRA